MNAGAVPVPIRIVEERTVDATLGSDSIRKSVIGGADRAAGRRAVHDHVLPSARPDGDRRARRVHRDHLAIFMLIPVTLTLAGIAGFILSIGMAVDANILIFERMREELRWGRSVGAAVRAGFDRAWTSIRDSNSSTLITCLLLYWFGQNFGASLITGFALTLAIGVLVSLFSAIFVTRGLLTAVMSSRLIHNPALFGMNVPGRSDGRAARSAGRATPDPGRCTVMTVDFVKHRKWFYLISLVLIIPGMISLILPGGLRPGIDFTSGTIMTLQFEQTVDQPQLREAFAALGHSRGHRAAR